MFDILLQKKLIFFLLKNEITSITNHSFFLESNRTQFHALKPIVTQTKKNVHHLFYDARMWLNFDDDDDDYRWIHENEQNCSDVKCASRQYFYFYNNTKICVGILFPLKTFKTREFTHKYTILQPCVAATLYARVIENFCR